VSGSPGSGLGTSRQEVPFQRTVRVWSAVPLLAAPTAQASLGEVAATAASVSERSGSGLWTWRQDAPSQRTIRV